MGLFDFFRRWGRSAEPPEGSATASGELPDLPTHPSGAGGPSPVATELSQLRFAAVSEAINVARSVPDPANWNDGRMQFEIERSTAHAHEAVRDQLSGYISAELAKMAAATYDAAIYVGLARERLRKVDHDLEQATEDWNRKYKLAQRDPGEVGRYYRSRSFSHWFWKVVVAIVLIAVELVMTSEVFSGVFPGSDLGPLATVPLAFGIIILLILVPHMAAIGLKEGLLTHHSFDRSDLAERGRRVPTEIRRMEEREFQEDRIFRQTAIPMAVVLLLLIFPLSWLRAKHVGSEAIPVWLWFILFALVQIGISMYFFLREWMDYGTIANDLVALTKRKGELEDERAEAVAGVGQAASAFNRSAENLLFVLQEAPRWDSYVVESYLTTIHQCRHLIGLENADIRPFVAGATIPYLGTREEAAESPYALEPLSWENASLEGGLISGRQWRVRLVGEEWRAELADLDEDEIDDSDMMWMITKSPTDMLEEILRRYFDLPASYHRPAIFDEIPDATEEGLEEEAASEETALEEERGGALTGADGGDGAEEEAVATGVTAGTRPEQEAGEEPREQTEDVEEQVARLPVSHDGDGTEGVAGTGAEDGSEEDGKGGEGGSAAATR